ncbi:MAG: enoyl-CoA hydratase-related protein [Bryobacteraceae bacterium]|nr:enoyl-CoA hydratase-related protein [Bryobacteraceae bacterium]MDW8379271.1 enoyl-CoA hydratase-related protein [Bryobacterales bacterium]
MYEQILYDVTDWVATVTLNRPDRLNAWTRQMEEEFNAALRSASEDERVRAIVITGAGRGFCAGADLSLLRSVAESGQPAEHRKVSGAEAQNSQRQHSWLLSIPKPLLAAIHGPAVGLGFVIPLYCDFRFASESASFNVIFSRRGLIAEYGLAWILPRLIGLPKALELMFTSRKVEAREALELGLVHRLLPDEGFVAAVQSFARELATTVSPRSLRIMKRQIYAAQSQTLDQAMDLAIQEMLESLDCEDFKEGVAHFLEKREPRFTGR